MMFRGFDSNGLRSIGVCELPWKVGSKEVVLTVHVVPGTTGLLISKPVLKELEAVIDMAAGTVHLRKLQATIQM